MDQQTLDALLAWIDAYADASEDVISDLLAALADIFSEVDAYDADQVLDAAQLAADQSSTAQLIAAGIAAQYVASTAGIIGDSPVGVPNFQLGPVRQGVRLNRVYERPTKLVRRLVSQGVPINEAWRRANAYIALLADGDIRLAQRQASDLALAGLGITGYRRIVRPELSRTGSCGLCIAASNRIYKTGNLMPIHNRCKCAVLPIVGDLDPGSSLNNLTLGDLYEAGGSTSAKDLKRARFTVSQHGEWGPILTREGDRFTGPAELLPAA